MIILEVSLGQNFMTFKFVKKLRASPVLRDVFVAGQEEKLVGSVKVIRFSVEATWGAI